MSFSKFDCEKKIWSGGENCSSLFHPNVTIGRAILYILSLNPEKICQICADDGTERTNKEIYEATLKIACSLNNLGCLKGDVVGFVCKNTHDFTPAVLAAFFLAAPVNVLDTSFGKEEIVHMFKTLNPKFVFCDDDVLEKVQDSLKALRSTATVCVLGKKIPNLMHISDLMNAKDKQKDIQKFLLNPPEVDRESCALIMCSSGTTGFPKGVAISHECLLMMYFRPYMIAAINQNDLMFSFCSLYWQSGYIFFLGSLSFGVPRLITSKTYSPNLWIEFVEKYRVTVVITPVSHTAQLLASNRLEKDKVKHIKRFFSNGDYIPKEMAEKFHIYMPNCILQNSYGSSEAGSIARKLSVTSNMFVGELSPGVTAKIVDKTGMKLGIGEIGELCVKTKMEFLGYFNNPGATEAIRDKEGWICTGDLASFDEDGILHVTGRKKFMMKYNGYSINPIEIEEILQKYPDVLQVVVVGIPDPMFKDLPAAVVEKKENSSVTEEELVKFVEERVVDFKRLRGGVYFVTDLPVTPSGKMKKGLIKEMAVKFFVEKQLKN